MHERCFDILDNDVVTGFAQGNDAAYLPYSACFKLTFQNGLSARCCLSIKKNYLRLLVAIVKNYISASNGITETKENNFLINSINAIIYRCLLSLHSSNSQQVLFH